MTGLAATAHNRNNLLPSIAHIIFLGVFILLTLSGDERLLGDADTGYHIRAGEFIIDNHTIPQADIFSYLTPPLRWTLHEWLSEVIMALVHRRAGLTGVVIFFASLISLSCYLVFELLLKPRSNLLFAAAAALLVVLASSSNWLARPHVFTFVLFVIWYHLLNGYQFRAKDRLIFLPPIMLLWVNLHGGFILGLVLLGIYWAGNCAAYFFGPPAETNAALNKMRYLTIIMIACGLAALINPYGYKSLLFPFQVVQDKFLMDHIAEYLSPNFHSSSVIPFEIMLLAMMGIFAMSGVRLYLIELILILLFAHMALFSSRHMPLFAIIAAPILLNQASMAFEKLDGRLVAFVKQRLDNLGKIDRSTNRLLWPIVGVLIVIALAAGGVARYDFNAKYVPKAAVEFIKNEDIKGNMFNNDEFGDYIIYAAWPAYKVFIDGRTDMYGAAHVKEYLKVAQAEAGWQSILEKYQITWVLHDPNSVLSKLLLEKNDWKLVYSDRVSNIFVKVLPEYREIINKYGTTQPFTEEITYTN
jgi:hypothetical protein